MRILVLGPMRVEVDARVTSPRGARSRDLLALLVARRGRAVTTETLLDLVWGADALTLTPTALHTAMARLRRQTAPALVVSTDLGYTIGEITCDADEFDAVVTSAATDATGLDDRIDRLRTGLSLWHGLRAYEGVSDHLVLAERTRLADLHQRATLSLAESLLGSGTDAGEHEAHDLARTLLSRNPLDESAAAVAMRAAYRSVGQGEALDLHDNLRRALRDELGVHPGAAIRELHAAVLAQDPSLERIPDHETQAGRVVTLHPGRLVPIPASPTIGRDADVATVLDALAEGRRLVTITGPGGVGKSRLLAEIGAALAPQGEVAHVSLGAHAALPVEELAASVALAAGVPLVGDDPVAGLVAALRTSTATVLADEAEWALSAAAALASALLAGCPTLVIVITSRVPLAVVGERVVVLDPLPTADPNGPMAAIRSSAAVHLLAERLADRGQLDATLDHVADDELRLVAEVAHRLDGLPLALEIVAGASQGSLPELPSLAEEALDVAADEHGRDDRHRSLRDALSWGVGRLGPQARIVLRRLGVFAGPFTGAAATAVVGDPDLDVERIVRDLARHNLLKVERTSSALSFVMLRVVRDLALDELAQAGEEAQTRQRHRRWFAGIWRDATLSDDLVEHVGRTHDDHLEALTDALAHGDDVVACDIALALCRRWQFVEASAIGARWTTRVLTLTGISDRQRARMEICRAGFHQGADWDDAHHEHLLATLEGDTEWVGLLSVAGAITAYVSGDLTTAQRHLATGRAAFDATSSKAATSALLPEIIATKAAVDAAAGDTEAAVLGARDALARVGAHRSAVHSVTVVPKIALALLDAGQPREALDLLTSAAADAEARFGILPTITTSVNAGWAALAVDDAAVALSWFRGSLTGRQAASAVPSIGEAAMGAGAALAALGHADAPEMLGLGQHLLDGSHQELPPTLAALVARATAAAGVCAPPPDWDVDLVITRIGQLVRSAGR